MDNKLEGKAREYLAMLLDQYNKKALGILRDYQAQRAYIEWALDVPMEKRQEYRQQVEKLKDGQLLKLRCDAQKMLGDVRLQIARLGDVDQISGKAEDLRFFGKRERERAREVIERLRGKNEQ